MLHLWRFLLQRIKTSPELIGSWRAHDSSIVSLEYIEHEDGNYIVSASTDHTARLWSTEGHYVGTFGQVGVLQFTSALILLLFFFFKFIFTVVIDK